MKRRLAFSCPSVTNTMITREGRWDSGRLALSRLGLLLREECVEAFDHLDKLKARRTALQAEITGIDKDLAALENPAPAPQPPAPTPAKAPDRPAKAQRIPTPAPVAIPAKKAKKPVSKAPAAKKPVGKPTLADSMAKVMTMGRRMRADEIIAAMAKAGFKSKSKNMRTMVYAALAKDKRFKKVGRGLYVVG